MQRSKWVVIKKNTNILTTSLIAYIATQSMGSNNRQVSEVINMNINKIISEVTTYRRDYELSDNIYNGLIWAISQYSINKSRQNEALVKLHYQRFKDIQKLVYTVDN